MTESQETARAPRSPRPPRPRRPPEYYDAVKEKFAQQRDLRLAYQRRGGPQFTSELTGPLAKYETDPYAAEVVARPPIRDTVEVLFIGGGFSALLTSARLRQVGVESIRIVERGADVGGDLVLEPLPGCRLRRRGLRLRAAARRDGLRPLPPLRRR